MVEGTTVAGNPQWQADSGFPYILNSTVTVNNGSTLNLGSGAVVKGLPNSKIAVSGTLSAQGVTFTSIKDDTVGGDTDGIVASPARGDWGGIDFASGTTPTGNLTSCTLRWGGRLYTAPDPDIFTTIRMYGSAVSVSLTGTVIEESLGHGIQVNNLSTAPPISGCTLRNNSYWGILYSNSPVNISGSTLNSNASGGIYLTGSSSTGQIYTSTFSTQPIGILCQNNANPVIGGSFANKNIFSGNTTYGVQNTTTTLTVKAEYNYWGNDSGPSGVGPGTGDPVSNYVDFDPWAGEPYTLSVTKSGTGNGTITSSPAGINCGSDCSEAYASGTPVTLTATPDASSFFTGWSGACSGTGACIVTMDAAKTVNAQFSPTSSTFDQDMIDRTVWADLEFVRFRNYMYNSQPPYPGWLESALTRYGSNGYNFLVFKDSGAVNSFQADVTVTAYENNGGVPHARLYGTVYNDGTSGDGQTGDVMGLVEIRHNGTQLEGFYSCFEVPCT